MALFPSTSIPSAASGYDINYSCRFDIGSTARLNRTPSSAGNQKTWTLSWWMKKTSVNGGSMFAWSATGGTEANWASGDKKFGGQYPGGWFALNGLQRDFSAWYHVVWIVDTTQATASNRLKIYFNGEQVTSWSQAPAAPSQNSDLHMNNTVAHAIGCRYNNSDFFDGYISEFHLIDGTAVPIETFGEFDTNYGHWKPIEVSGVTYGTNGCYLDFANSGNLGNDAAGSNNWTSTNLTTSDQVTDSPTNNWCTLTPLQKDAGNSSHTYSEGNLKVVESGGGGYWRESFGTFEVPKTDKWYMEFYHVTGYAHIGLMSGSDAVNVNDAIQPGHVWYDYDTQQGGSFTYNNVTQTTGATGANLVYAISVDAGVVKFYQSNVVVHTFPQNLSTAGLNAVMPIVQMYGGATWVANFGQDHTFAGNKSGGANAQDSEGIGSFYYSPPAGHKALCSKNLPEPAVKPSEHFNTILYDDGAGAKTGVGFQPDLVWVKSRGSAYGHRLTDAVRGVTKAIDTDAGAVEATDSTGLTAFGADGFTVGADTDYSDTTGDGMVAWCWKGGNATSGTGDFTQGSIASTCSRNVDAGFSIVSYTGTGSAGTVGHGLSVAPNLVIARNRDLGRVAVVGSVQSLASMDFTDYIALPGVDAKDDNNTMWNDTAPTASVFSVLSIDNTNRSSDKYIAYCFHNVEGYSKIGSYKGNANVDGSFIYCGFSPAYILIKVITASGEHWLVHDSTRSTYNVSNKMFRIDLAEAEQTASWTYIDILSNGFKTRVTSGNMNASASYYLFYTIAETPFKYATSR